MRESTPRILTGMYAFDGRGYDTPVALGVTYSVPGDRRAQMIYFRAGSSASEMVAVVLTRDGTPMRVFPIGAKGAVHIPVVVYLAPVTTRQGLSAARAGAGGTLALDVGMVEI